MRKIFSFLAILVLAVSCLDTSEFRTAYTSSATFDYDDAQFNADSIYFDTEYKIGILWDYMGFYHKVDDVTSEFKGGFLLSNLQMPASGETAGLSNNLYRANVKSGTGTKNKYAVFCLSDDMPQAHFAIMKQTGVEVTCAAQAMYVTNSVAVEDAVRSSFTLGDCLVLKATGYLAGEKTGDAEIKLAEFTTAKDSVVTSWTVFDLSKLNVVDKIMFDLQAPEGKDVPTVVCVDGVIMNISLKSE